MRARPRGNRRAFASPRVSGCRDVSAPEAAPLSRQAPPAIDRSWVDKPRSGAQRLAAPQAACVEDLAAGLGGHAGAKAVPTLAHEVRRLEGAFHRCVSRTAAVRARIVLRARPQF